MKLFRLPGILMFCLLCVTNCLSLYFLSTTIKASKIKHYFTSSIRIFSTEENNDIGSDNNIIEEAILPIKLEEQSNCGPCPLAPKCSGAYKEKGCDGLGKIFFNNVATVL